MKKTTFRDYAVSAFILWSKWGGATAFKNKIWADAIEKEHKAEGIHSGISNPTEAAVMKAQEALEQVKATVDDLEAVDRVMDMLKYSPNGKDILFAVERVYMTLRKVSKGEIKSKVIRCSIDNNVSERKVYRDLAQARILFAKERGLRISWQ